MSKKTRKLAKADFEIYGRMFWSRVWRQGYTWDSTVDFLKTYGLSYGQTQKIVKYAEQNRERWERELAMIERAAL